MASLLCDLLDALGVPHTRHYADRAFASMPFKSLFGFSRQLKAYGVDSVAARWPDKSVFTSIPTPFLAQMAGGRFVIIERIDTSADSVTCRCQHKGLHTGSLADLMSQWNGLALLAYPSPTAAEPSLRAHRLLEMAYTAKGWILSLCAIILLFAGAVNAGCLASHSRIPLLLVDMAGIAITWLLILKSLKVSSRSADRICGIMKDHGCDTVLEQKASSFFGIFSWSEVGITYFSISTVALLAFPQSLPWLALANLCCLPFTLWSIWYQHWRLHTWCTLCVTTQALLWLQAGAYLLTGAWHHFSLSPGAIILLAAYGFTLMGVNRIMNFIKSKSEK
ncbi:MAG: vitamin K epoxide reductase family protein [Pseudoflavonifractor sp.]|nr:vitamin K epoxide reductase family protein [Alloprevotella sp.]MCM1116543.1 vitamin K epoxide reductase family protein [Pseudoflavonifractor sp.]